MCFFFDILIHGQCFPEDKRVAKDLSNSRSTFGGFLKWGYPSIWIGFPIRNIRNHPAIEGTPIDGKPHLLDSVSLQASYLEILIKFLRFPEQGWNHQAETTFSKSPYLLEYKHIMNISFVNSLANVRFDLWYPGIIPRPSLYQTLPASLRRHWLPDLCLARVLCALALFGGISTHIYIHIYIYIMSTLD